MREMTNFYSMASFQINPYDSLSPEPPYGVKPDILQSAVGRDWGGQKELAYEDLQMPRAEGSGATPY